MWIRECLITVPRTEGKLASERGLPDFPPITGNHAFFRCSLRLRGISTDHRQHVMDKHASRRRRVVYNKYFYVRSKVNESTAVIVVGFSIVPCLMHTIFSRTLAVIYSILS
jgi:hypothetical protein